MVAAVPIGSRSTAPANSRVIPAEASPSSAVEPSSRAPRPRSRGLVSASRTAAAKVSRRKVAPPTPSCPNSGLDSAMPSCTANIATTQSTGAGTRADHRGPVGWSARRSVRWSVDRSRLDMRISLA